MRGLGALVALAGLAAAGLAHAAEPARAPIFFNHVDVHVSQETYRAIVQEPMVKTLLGRLEERTTVRDGGKTRYSGAYLYGARTYLEFIEGPPEAGGRHLAFALWLDRQADLKPLLPRLAAVPGAQPRLSSTTRQFPGGEVPWFDYLDPLPDGVDPPPGVAAAFWVMSVAPGYLKARYPDLRPEEDGTSREQQYARLHDPDRPFGDVDRVSLEVGPREAVWLTRELRALRLPETDRPGGTTAFSAGDTTFVIRRLATDAGRRVIFHLKLDRPMTHKSARLGETHLEFDGERAATWEFPG